MIAFLAVAFASRPGMHWTGTDVLRLLARCWVAVLLPLCCAALHSSPPSLPPTQLARASFTPDAVPRGPSAMNRSTLQQQHGLQMRGHCSREHPVTQSNCNLWFIIHSVLGISTQSGAGNCGGKAALPRRRLRRSSGGDLLAGHRPA